MNITRKNIVYDDYIKVIYNNHLSTVHDVYIQNPENTHINDQVQLPLHIVSSHNNSNNYTEHDNVSFRRHSMPLPPEYIAKPQPPNKIRRISRLVKQDISNIDTTYARRTSQSTPTTPNNKKDIYIQTHTTHLHHRHQLYLEEHLLTKI